MLRPEGVTFTVATRCCTTIWAESFEPPASVATTHVPPFVAAVTRPDVLTVATVLSRLAQVNEPLTLLPAESFAWAVSWTVAVKAVRVSRDGVTTVLAAPVPFAEIVSGEPTNPAAVAVIVCAPPADPRVQVVLARPCASVVADGVPTLPPPAVTANATV